MDAELLQALTRATLASSVSILLVGLLRKPFRAAMGARAAYCLWMLIPALVLASLLPAPAQSLQVSFVSLPDEVRSALSAVAVTPTASRGSMALIAGLARVGARRHARCSRCWCDGKERSPAPRGHCCRTEWFPPKRRRYCADAGGRLESQNRRTARFGCPMRGCA